MAKQSVAKVTLSSGKIVLLRELRIADTESAAQLVAVKSNGDSNVLQLLMQKELLKLSLVAIDETRITPIQKEDMDSLFKLGEYSQLLRVIAKMSGGEDAGKDLPIELVMEE